MKKKQTPPPHPFRMTPQRAEILRLLDGNRAHPSAEDIYARLRRKLPGLSFATVYNNLQALLCSGELAEVRIDGSRRRFDPCTAPHAHLMCVGCGAIADVAMPAVPARPRGAPRGFRVLRGNVDYYGTCPACGNKAERKRRKTPCNKRTKKR